MKHINFYMYEPILAPWCFQCPFSASTDLYSDIGKSEIAIGVKSLLSIDEFKSQTAMFAYWEYFDTKLVES